MSDLPDRSDLRASDADRDRVAELLRAAAGDGRLTLAELEERLDLTFQARTYGELAPLTRDLPAASGSMAAPPAVQLGEPAQDVTAVLGSQKLNGRFVCPPVLHARAVLGEVKIDFTEAIVPRGEVVVEVSAVLGSVELTLPEGVDVRMEPGHTILGERKSTLPPPSSPGAPVIRVRGTVLLGELKAQPRRWERLRRMLTGD